MVAEDMNATIKTNVLYIINYIVIITFIGFKNSKTSIRQSSIRQDNGAKSGTMLKTNPRFVGHKSRTYQR